MRLYHVPGSRSDRVLWTLEEIGQPYDLSPLTWESRGEAEHRTRHPLGRVPVVHDGEGHVFESAAICLHLADTHPEAGLVPAPGTRERALVYQWLFYAMIELEGPIGENYAYRESEPERAAAGVERYRVAAAVIESELAGKEYLVGGTFSVADIIVGGVLSFAQMLDMNEGFPNIAAYLQRLDARPALQRANAGT